MLSTSQDTIAAQATPPGRGGVGIIRLSGPDALNIAKQLLGFTPKPRHAHYAPFLGAAGEQLDQGIALYFPNPHSFTGEDVVEFQGHGGPVIIDMLLHRAIALGARLARPGEFSERAFLNDKLDLAQAEAIADLIDSSSEQAARCALRSLQGAFSERVHALVEALIQLRIYVEAAIDFPEEEIDFLADGKVQADLEQILTHLQQVRQEARQGSLMREGMNVVIAGRPNAGKSSLLNALAGRETAIVTDIEGTTRDVLREHIHIDGMPLHIIDTAGLRDAPDAVERIGIDRAWDEIRKADRILMMVDSTRSATTDPAQLWPELADHLDDFSHVTLIRNKADLTGESIGLEQQGEYTLIRLSAKGGSGVDLLRQHLKEVMGFSSTTEGGFMARRRHIDALERARELLETGSEQLLLHGAGELLAEDLRQAQQVLGEITGQFSSDDLLGRIFSSFCIGK
ncbi:MAG: tRNA uridine-5-carboxymethylaminomethyl(34) synthesis GTPase MnmE [Oceanospirillales bacterium]|uniref:tRNA modification GTPase MnmE n=1 Tax=Marinobacterium halophilum TaxID=267374 RepID=A0A2P8EW21_9GAMM|nr:tRNA uridine-5-carboxymethylaminomethyl(34) synthesis GTPase MnmE [Marinobacterium halophilum]MBR9827067.1 tRNA uridine-5-carboxymethylaminomethyl(34) synthesis GTPase MnmE [Oceanospirillales bacterium]PSL13670.1 tRNA modification GTPase trmE [Marinobacterium halophilum]